MNLVEKGLSKVNKRIYGSEVAVMGLAYKKNIDDTREFLQLKLLKNL